MRENPSRSAVFEILPSRLAPTTIPCSKSLKSPFFPILMLSLNFSKSLSPCLACSSSQRCPTFCYGFWLERHVSWKWCATESNRSREQPVSRVEIRFLLFGGCVKNVSPISSNMNINRAVLKRPLTQWVHPSEVVYKCVRCCSVYTIIEDIRRHVCLKSFIEE